MNPKSWLPDTPSFLAILLVVSIVGLVFLLAVLGKTDTDTFKILVGALMSVGFTNIVGFYFGSSQGSKEKDATLATIAGGSGNTAAMAAAATVAAPPAAAVAAPPAAEVAVAEALEKRDNE